VEEAIVVLKNNKKINKLQLANKKQENVVEVNKKEDKQYIIKEAEMLISNYIKEVEKPIKVSKSQKNLQKKYDRLKKINRCLAFASFISFIAYLIK
jgi:hypothetical protein